MSIKILLVNDHPTVRTNIKNELNRHQDFCVVGEAVDSEAAINQASLFNPDVILIDINIPGPTTAQIVRALQDNQPEKLIVILSDTKEREFILGMFNIGVKGYLLKDEPPEVIAQAIRAVTSGLICLSSGVIRSIPDRINNLDIKVNVSKEEARILWLLANGKKDVEIGNEVGIAERTVRLRLRHIYDKLGVNTRTELVAWAVRSGLI